MATKDGGMITSDDQETNDEQLGYVADMHQFKDEISRLRRDAMEFTRRLEDLTSQAELSAQMSNVLLKSYDLPASTAATKNRLQQEQRRKKSRSGQLPEKEFVMQNSVLTDLFDSKHMQTNQNVIVALVIWWIISAAVNDYYKNHNIFDALPSLTLIQRSCVNGHLAFFEWLKLVALSLLIYPLTRFWANHRPDSHLKTRPFYDLFFSLGYMAYQVLFLVLPFRMLYIDKVFGTAAVVSLTMEQVRMMMKMHSFVREVARDLNRTVSAEAAQKKNDDNEATDTWKMPNIGKYLYFLAAPTLIYRNEYPRNATIRWRFVLSNFIQFLTCTVYMYYIVDRHLIPELQVYKPEIVSFEVLLKCWIRCTIPGLAAQMLSFFGFFHSWLNMWAEMLRFGDRVFYKDWWNCTDYGAYWRQWNCVVHDWLYAYIYKECYETLKIGKIGKAVSAFCVFFVSSFFHEYIVTAMLKFYYPIMFVYLGGIGYFLTLIDMRNAGRFRLTNVFMWWGSIMFMGLMFCLYAFEVAARDICPPFYPDNWFLDGSLPRFAYCWGRKMTYNYS